jgi:hypothetical protein
VRASLATYQATLGNCCRSQLVQAPFGQKAQRRRQFSAATVKVADGERAMPTERSACPVRLFRTRTPYPGGPWLDRASCCSSPRWMTVQTFPTRVGFGALGRSITKDLLFMSFALKRPDRQFSRLEWTRGYGIGLRPNQNAITLPASVWLREFGERGTAMVAPFLVAAPACLPLGNGSMQSCGVHYAAAAVASSSLAGRKPG